MKKRYNVRYHTSVFFHNPLIKSLNVNNPVVVTDMKIAGKVPAYLNPRTFAIV